MQTVSFLCREHFLVCDGVVLSIGIRSRGLLLGQRGTSGRGDNMQTVSFLCREHFLGCDGVVLSIGIRSWGLLPRIIESLRET
jgi:hypothetical protein